MLSRVTLQRAFQRILDPKGPGFTQFPKTAAEAAANWAQVYQSYAAAATDVSTDVLVTANPAAFEAALVETFTTARSPQQFASGIAQAFTAYWTGAVFAVGIPPTPAAVCPTIGGLPTWSSEVSSLVTAVNAGPLESNMSAELSILSTNGVQKAANIAGILDAATKSGVIVTILGLDTTPPPVGPLENTNICTIF